MTHHELMMENEKLKEQMMTEMQKDLVKKLLRIVFMDWKEEWRKEGYGSCDAHTGEINNPNPLSCNKHNGCPCGGDNKIRAMFGNDELEELYSVLDKLREEDE